MKNRMKIMNVIVGAALGLALCGCGSIGVRKFATFAAAAPIPPKADVRCYFGSETDLTGFPALIPMARVDAQYRASNHRSYVAKLMMMQADRVLRSDVIIYFDGEPYFAGTVSSAVGSPLSGGGAVAFGSSSAVYMTPLIGICMRLAPAKLAVSWDGQGEINFVGDKARPSGITEGDRLISIDGTPVLYGEQSFSSPHLIKALAWKPGQQVKLVWMRPEEGRMEGIATLEENPPTYMQVQPVQFRKSPDQDQE